MKILFLGDIVSVPGRKALKTHLQSLREKHGLTAVIANGENAAQNGKGLTAADAQEIFSAGVDVITLGDHTFDQRGFDEFLAGNPKIIRPFNYPPGTVGRGHVMVTIGGKRIAVVNIQGRVFMRQLIDCPFRASTELQERYKLGVDCDALIVDVHAEATSEKCNLGAFWDGKASLVVGTHTHIPTSDTRVQPKGTAYQTDAGMCGDYNSSLGVSYESALPSFTTAMRYKFDQVTGEGTLSGVIVTVGENGLATAAEPLRVGGCLQPTA
ncbi:MAG: metallophosphoesterase [Pseudomonas fluorescens]|nr:MAG: metallophosphoesterase [Pseudomonas fluorescens]